jgi:hypothetical protein
MDHPQCNIEGRAGGRSCIMQCTHQLERGSKVAVKKLADLFRVEGYGVVVTGGASGLGLGFTETMAGNGARVTMLDIDPKRIAEETRRLQEAGLDVRGAVVDVCDHPALDRAVDEAAALYGRLDVVFANAGVDSGPGFANAIRRAHWRPTPTSAGTRSSRSISTVCSRPAGQPPATCGRGSPAGSSSPPRSPQ